jgi:SAM-dependent methyltransferase
MVQQSVTIKKRTPEQIREHYEIEKELANKLRNASKQERRFLYSSLYDELFRRVPYHSQLTKKASPSERLLYVSHQIRLIQRYLGKDDTFLEIGAGDCALSFEAAKYAQRVYAIDVSDEITKSTKAPENFHLILSDGCSVPVHQNSVNVAYSDQLMEHLHPDDAFEQLHNVFDVLAPGGVYIVITPNRLTGPHDISRYYDEIATGFHLKEYTFTELSMLFKQVGFSRVVFYMGGKGVYMKVPAFPILLVEKFLSSLKPSFRKVIAQNKPVIILLNIHIIGIK